VVFDGEKIVSIFGMIKLVNGQFYPLRQPSLASVITTELNMSLISSLPQHGRAKAGASAYGKLQIAHTSMDSFNHKE
jgi:hypothetical protein